MSEEFFAFYLLVIVGTALILFIKAKAGRDK